eukprot:4552041-Pleurochrysis_carterae.AAC.1
MPKLLAVALVSSLGWRDSVLVAFEPWQLPAALPAARDGVHLRPVQRREAIASVRGASRRALRSARWQRLLPHALYWPSCK